MDRWKNPARLRDRSMARMATLHANPASPDCPPAKPSVPNDPATTIHPHAATANDPADQSGLPRIIRRRSGLYMPGVAYAVITLFVGVGAFNAQNNLLFFVFGVALATLIVTGLIAELMLRGATVCRVVLGPAELGREAPIAYRVTNRNRFVPLFAIRISETPAPPPNPQSNHPPQPPDQSSPSNASTGSPVVGVLSRTRAFAAYVPAGASIMVPAHALARSVGSVTLSGFRVSTIFPFGVTRKSFRAAQPANLVIHHPRVDLAPNTAAAINALAQSQLRSIPTTRADGQEFFGVREYTPGDPLRLIAWRASARSGELRSRIHAAPPRLAVRIILSTEGLSQQPEPIAACSDKPTDQPTMRSDPLGWALSWPLRVLRLIDASPPELPPLLSPTDRALSLAASLTQSLLTRGCQVELLEADGRFRVPMGAGAAQRDRMLDTLALRRSPNLALHQPATTRHDHALEILLSLQEHTGTASALPLPLPGVSTLRWSYQQLAGAIKPHREAQAS